MSSSGNISKVFSPTTISAENRRQVSNSLLSLPGTQEQIRRVDGIITEINPDYPRLVKVKQNDNSPVANGKWISLNHSAQEIAEKWGTVRLGFKVRVTYSGPAGVNADATIIATEDKNVNEPHQANEADRGLYLIFPPGGGTL